MEHPENQDWQRACTKCGKVKCPKVEKVAEWMRNATDETFKGVEHFASEDPRMRSWREQASFFSIVMEQHLVGWSRCLEGVCFDCQKEAFPAEDERLDDPEGIGHEHWLRWAFAVPLVQEQRRRDAIRAEVLAEVAVFNAAGAAIADALRPPATWKIRTEKGEKEVPCAWARGGLVVVMIAEANLEKSKADRAEGKEGVYPTQCWSVTHAASGLAVAMPYDMPDDAVEAARRLLPLVDWTLPLKQCSEAVKASQKARDAVAMERTRASLF